MLSSCQEHNYCPHQHYNKCYKERSRSVGYGIVPGHSTNLPYNQNPYKVDTKLRNIPTLAYENYTCGSQRLQNTNYVTNYYLQHAPIKTMINTIVADTELDMSKHNAYHLAIGATKDYCSFEEKRKSYLKSARRRAKQNYNHYFQELAKQKAIDDEANLKWFISLIRKLDTLIEHMLGIFSQKEDNDSVQNRFLNQCYDLKANVVAGVKVTEPKEVLGVLKSVKALLLQHKKKFEEERQNQKYNASASQQASLSQDNLQASFVSAQTVSSVTGQTQQAERYCNFDQLKKKWKADSVEQVKQIIMRVLTNLKVSHAEPKFTQARALSAVKRKTKVDIKTQTKDINVVKTTKKQTLQSVNKLSGLTKEELEAKTALMRGRILDTNGQIYLRNRNYSMTFAKKQNIYQKVFVVEENIESGKQTGISTKADLKS